MELPILQQLANYASLLSASAAQTTRSEDRDSYRHHLAAVAEMLGALGRSDTSELQRLVESERHSFGWGYLSGDAGSKAEKAFAEFDRSVGNVASPPNNRKERTREG